MRMEKGGASYMPPVPPILSSTNSRGKIPTGAQNRTGRGGGVQAQGGAGGGGVGTRTEQASETLCRQKLD
jgi:hypothetical protein